MEPAVSILCTGNEILDGRISDTNSRLLISAFEELGLEVRHILSCRDSKQDIIESLRFLIGRSRLIVVSGGLGPTSDDVTREAVAEFLGCKLVLDPHVLEQLKARYRERKRTFDISNTKQVEFPDGAVVLPNPVGTAAGFRCRAQGQDIIVVPGVPHELERMFRDHIGPFAKELFGSCMVRVSKVLRIFGRSEAKVGELVEYQAVPDTICVSYRANFPEIFVKLSATAENAAALDSFFVQAKQSIGADFIFSDSAERNLEQTVHHELTRRNISVAVAESCTGGGISSLLTNTAGSSRYFMGGVVSYSNAAKSEFLGVPPESIGTYGAVSSEVACAMATGARARFATDIGISVTGIAGPDGGSAEKPVGTFFVGLVDARTVQAFHCFMPGPREMIRAFACYTTLDILRRHIQGFELRPKDIIGSPQLP